MIQIKKYPVFVNYSNPDSEDSLEYEFARKGDTRMVDWLRQTGRRTVEARGSGITRESTAWEEFVADQLNTVCQNAVGKLLFDSLDPDVEVYIVPFHKDERRSCGCGGAGTLGVFNKKQGGGIRVFFSRGDPAMKGYYGADDVLLHEMVHAYRIGRVTWSGQKRTQLDGYNTAEEFLAIHLQNVYLDFRGRRHYYFSHWEPVKRSKGDIYSEFTEAGEPLLALKYYLDNEPVAQTVATWPFPHPDFNPWRDYPQLLNLYQRKWGYGQMTPL